MLSGVISTLERIFANGFEGADGVPRTGVFRPLVRAVGLVGVPGEGLDAGLTPRMEAHTAHLCCFVKRSFFGSRFPQIKPQQSSGEREQGEAHKAKSCVRETEPIFKQ